MAPSLRLTHLRSLASPGRLGLVFLLLLLAAVEARAQAWTFRPVFTLSIGYDSNVVFTPGESSPGDYFGGLGLRAPLSGRLSQRSTFAAIYAANGEWYQDLKGLNTFPSRQNAAVGWSYADGDATTFGLGAGYSESRRPEEVFPESGLGYVRGRTKNPTAYANVGHRLSQRTRFDLGYAYGRPVFAPTGAVEQRAESHSGTASLGRDLKPGSTLSVRYQYRLYERADAPRDQSHVVGLAFTRAFGKSTNLSLFGGARFRAGEVGPEASVSLGHSWRTSHIAASYSKTRNYIPTTGDFSDTDSARLTYSVGQRRFRLSLSAGYSHNRFEEGALRPRRDLDAYWGALDTVYMLKRWLGLGANYRYNWQRSGNTDFDDRSRHLALAGLVVAPWNGKEAQGLR